jgi:hypothetical protein
MVLQDWLLSQVSWWVEGACEGTVFFFIHHRQFVSNDNISMGSASQVQDISEPGFHPSIAKVGKPAMPGL